MLKPVVGKYRNYINFATIDAVEFGFFAEPLGLKPGRFPAFVIEDVLSGDTAPFDQGQKITADLIGNFIKTFLTGRKRGPDVKVRIPQNNLVVARLTCLDHTSRGIVILSITDLRLFKRHL